MTRQRTRTHIIDPDAFTRSGRERPRCGAFGALFSPMVEHPDDADCQRCHYRYQAWERRQAYDTENEMLLAAARDARFDAAQEDRREMEARLP